MIALLPCSMHGWKRRGQSLRPKNGVAEKWPASGVTTRERPVIDSDIDS